MYILYFIHNGSNCVYHFIIKVLAEEFKKQFTFLGENTKKYITFTVPIGKKVTRIDKNEEEITKNLFTYYNLLIVQGLWQPVLPIIFLKEFIKLNVNTNIIIKNVNLAKLNISIATVILNTRTWKMI